MRTNSGRFEGCGTFWGKVLRVDVSVQGSRRKGGAGIRSQTDNYKTIRGD